MGFQTNANLELINDVTGSTTVGAIGGSVNLTSDLLKQLYIPEQSRIGIYVTPSADFVTALLSTWHCGHIAVPLPLSAPGEELAFLVADAGISYCFSTDGEMPPVFQVVSQSLKWLQPVRSTIEVPIPDFPVSAAAALMIYTSGTTSRPKGVVLSHVNLHAQISSLTAAWKWSREDVILNVLPLHHVHGLINVLCCALFNAALCDFMPKFDARAVWNWFGTPSVANRKPTLFMAVPTIYTRLIQEWEKATPEVQSKWSADAGSLRLMVSGSAALPESVLHRWEQLTGHRLLERYGMTEIGMALSNPLGGMRKPGSVGKPLPGVYVRVRADGIITDAAEVPGELEVKGANVFQNYWNNADITSASFTSDGWFKTGDVAMRDPDGDFRMLGRSSQDIIKTGGYKVSALETESALLEVPGVSECAVVGIADPEWGERVAAVLVLHVPVSAQELKELLKAKLAPYKIPSAWRFVSELPRNAMGKVRKPELRSLFAG